MQKLIHILSIIIIASTISGCKSISHKQLPPYQVYHEGEPCPPVLRSTAKSLTFPLTEEDNTDIRMLKKKFEQETNVAGLAAPQIGISKRFIIFEIPNDPEIKAKRKDLTQVMPKTIWINPSYEGIGTDTTEDYEACVSVENLVGIVTRFKQIRYSAVTIDNKLVNGIADGFLARVLQHEIDHLNGILYIDLIPPEKIITNEEYKELRSQTK